MTWLAILIVCFAEGHDPELPYLEDQGRYLTQEEVFVPLVRGKRAGLYSKADWAQAIDATWGTGPTTADKLALFDFVWQDIHDHYGAFHNTEVRIQEIRERYRSEIAGGVSRGRFAGIMTHFMFQLKELHTSISDNPVIWGTPLNPGVPIMIVGAWSGVSHFGAALTPLSDGTALVYRVAPNHVLGLEPGDVVLGYHGRPWRELYAELIKAELPIRRHGGIGSTDEALAHSLDMAVGENWHLFDSIDIRKFSTGETVSLATAALVNQSGQVYGNEQLPVAGVPMPDWTTNNHLTWGRVTNTNVGYIYVGSWSTNTAVDIENKFYQAILELQDTDGLIVDFRRNLGGYMLMAHRGYALLFNKIMRLCAFDVRGNDADDFFSVKPHPQFGARRFTFATSPDTYYNQPIAVLSGPGAQSNGDWESIRMRAHEKVRSFGKPSNGGFTSSDNPKINDSNWWYQKATGSGYVLVDNHYLTHVGSPVDEEVWLTPEDTALGIDTVVTRALSWIDMKNRAEPDHVYYLPEINSDGPGEALLSLVNPNDHEVTIHVEGIGSNGISYGPSSTTRSLAPGAMHAYGVNEWFPGVVDLADWIRITSSAEIAVYVELLGEGTSSAYRPGSELTQQQVVPHIAVDSEKFETHLAAVNGAAWGMSVDLTGQGVALGWNQFGNPWTQSQQDILNWWQEDLPGWVTVVGDRQQLSMMEWFAYRDGTLGKAALGLSTSGSRQLKFLHIAKETQVFWTGLVYLNPSSAEASVQETYYSDNGQVVGIRDLVLAAGQKTVVLVDASTAEVPNASWLEVQSDQDLFGYQLFGSAEGRAQRFVVGLPAAGEPSDSLIFDRVPTSTDDWTGLVMVNTSDHAASIRLELRDSEGQVLTTHVVNSVPGKSKLTRLVKDLFPDHWQAGAWIKGASTESIWSGFLLWGDAGAEREYLSGVDARP